MATRMGAKLGLCYALVALMVRTCVGERGLPEWETAFKQSETHHGDGTHPSVRYSHGAATWGDEMIVTHGAAPPHVPYFA
eukprot:9437883-Pyramimonas_sp.AAC.1